jgi:hypothetical protein
MDSQVRFVLLPAQMDEMGARHVVHHQPVTHVRLAIRRLIMCASHVGQACLVLPEQRHARVVIPPAILVRARG